MSSHHFVTVCVVCVLCAARTPCSAHTSVSLSSTVKTPFSSSTKTDAVASSWTVSRSGGSPDSTGGIEPGDYAASMDPRRIKDSKKLISKKYAHSYSEERATRRSTKVITDVDRTTSNPEILERLGQLSDEEINDENRRNDGNMISGKLRNRRGVEIVKKYTKELFETYGDGTSLSIDGFERLLKKLGLVRLLEDMEKMEEANVQQNQGQNQPKDGQNDYRGSSNDPNGIGTQQKCLTSRELLSKVSRETSQDDVENSNKTAKIADESLPDWLFTRVCPVLIYHLAGNTSLEREGCIVPLNAYSSVMGGTMDEIFVVGSSMKNDDGEDMRNMFQVWVYSTLSIVIISLCGLLGVLVIPVMGKSYYHQLLQFLVALAIGTLCGDALIHLLPHAMMASHSEGHEMSTTLRTEADVEAEHNQNMWKGLTAMCGLIAFFFAEKALAMIAEWRKHRQRKNKIVVSDDFQLPGRVRVMRETDGANSNNVGEKLCKHKYSSYPYCYGEITTETRDNHHDHHHNDRERATPLDEEKPLTSNSNSIAKIMTNDEVSDNNDLRTKITDSEDWRLDGDVPSIIDDKSMTNHRHSHRHDNHNHHHHHHHNNPSSNNQKQNDENDRASGDRLVTTTEINDVPLNEAESYTVIIREHENKHHGHTHSHGHVHAAPDSMSSVAWMVVMGDGLHNFTDGMAIGAAFASNIAGGFSTAIAVFCHELPHELGDFAVLLKAGMSWRQALFYNLLSSVLCLFGMIIGVLLGAAPAATSWIFAAAAGMFIYIALVDMIPELSSSHSEEGGSRWECVLQATGLITGLGIMLIIALYEHDLKHIFSD